MIRVILVCLFWLVAAPHVAQAQDCSSALMQRVCANPDLTALEQERQALVGGLAAIDAAHPALAQEETWLSVQEACADDACLAAGYRAHNQVLRDVIASSPAPETSEPLAELPTIAAPELRNDEPEPASGGGHEVNPDPPFQFSDYIGVLIALPLTFLIAFWLLGKAKRARERD